MNMEFFKSAVASIAKGPAFGYSFGDRIDLGATADHVQEDGSRCSIFSFDVSANRSRLPLAKNALRKFRTLRHPGVVKVLDTLEVERITPLTWSTQRKSLSEESLKWGLHSVAKTIKFINDEAASVHGNLRASSVFTSESGEWKLAGFEILSSMKEDDAVIFTQGSVVPDIGRYSPPEVTKNGWASVRGSPVHAVDAYDYGILISEVFNGAFSGSDQVGSTKNVPVQMTASYKRLTHAVPKMRLSVGHFLEQGSRHAAFFDTPLIQLANGIENLGLKSESERDIFLNELEAVAESDDFPEDFFKVKVLPELLKAIEFGGGGPKSFSLVMRIASKLSEDEYDTQITPVVVRLFGSPDRALRVCLLDNLPLMIDHLSQKLVTDKIFPQMVTGFTDLAPIVREQTVKAVLVVVPKLSDRVINGELLRHLAKTANDEQPGIRTNTTICLGKIARNLGASTRAKVLNAAFSRSLRDPFVHARNASLMALAATVDVFPEEDCAVRMLPAICPLLVDKEKMIRDQANKTFNIYLDRVRRYGVTLPTSVLPAPESSSAPDTRAGTPQPGNQWMGWAISSFTNKISTASGDMQTNSNGVPVAPHEQQQRSTSTPPVNNPPRRPLSHTAPSAPVVPRAPSGLRDSTVAAASEAEDEDFGTGWGDLDDDPANDPWNQSNTFSETSSAPHSAKPSVSSVSYDDGGEPDFEGWLNAQAQAKSQSKRPLPKGLAKKTPAAARPAVAVAHTAAKKTAMTPAVAKSKSTPTAPHSKKEVPKAEEEDDDWGDAWG
nr:isoform 5 of n-terminal kinase-like protein [Quercus suber]